MPTLSYATTCLSNEEIANETWEFRLSKPEGFSFESGQFVLFDVPLVENPEDIQPRAFSIASTPAEDAILIVAKMKAGGRASRWVSELLHEGIPVTMTGPFGRFLLNRKTSKDYVFIATSSGIAPFRSQILDALLKGDTRRMDLIFGLRTEEDMFWTDELNDLAKKHENFFMHYALSNPAGSWKGHRGRVQTLVPLIIKDFSNKSVYICGNPDMTNELKKLCLEEWRVRKEDLHVEGYV